MFIPPAEFRDKQPGGEMRRLTRPRGVRYERHERRLGNAFD